jgi:ComF family protein
VLPTALLDLLCPPICPICGEVVENSVDNPIENPSGKEEPICSACVPKIVTPDGQFCFRCGGRRSVTPNDTSNCTIDNCTRCRTADFRFKRVIALGEYETDLRLLTLRMKTDKTGFLAISAAKMLALYRRSDLDNVQADHIVPVPMHRLRRWDRGVSSPDLLADELGLRLKIPVARHLIRRIRQTDLQYTLSPKARAENVRGAFALCPPSCLAKLGIRRFSPSIVGKNILLIDDILTTGSTCNEITKVLLSAGVGSVTVAVLARAEGSFRREG